MGEKIVNVDGFTFSCDENLEMTEKIMEDIKNFIKDIRLNQLEEDEDYAHFTLLSDGEATIIF